MKQRSGFVSNSSSSSFIIRIPKSVDTFEEFLKCVMFVHESEWHLLYPQHKTWSGYKYNLIRIYETIWEDVQHHMVSMAEAKKFAVEHDVADEGSNVTPFFDGEYFNYAIVGYADEDGDWWGLVEHGSHWNMPCEIGTVISISEH